MHVIQLIALAAGTAALTGLAGALLLWALRRRAIGLQVAAVALVTLGAVALAVVVGAKLMFLSERDVTDVVVLLASGSTVAVFTALALGRRVERASASLVDATRRLGEEGAVLLEPRHVVGSSELARLGRQLEETSARLDAARIRERALDDSRRELVAWVSHDLRTPLAGLRAMAEALEDGVVDDPATIARDHATMRVEVDRLAALVGDLFELSQTQAGALQLHLERVALGDLVTDLVAGTQPLAEAKGVRLERRVATAPLVLSVSTPELLRALRNIIENAIRHTPSDGTIVVEAGRDADRAYVSVLDDGGGIPEADLDRVFQVAFRGDAARTPGGGAGLGLAIARGLVEAHDGDVSVCNENGGCRFTVRLPL